MPEQRLLTLVLVAAVVTAMVKRTLIGDPRWWNLVMAALLLMVLALYLYRERLDRD